VQRGLPPPALPSLLGAAPVAAPAPKPAQGRPTPASREDRQAAKQSRNKLAERTRPLRHELKQIDERLARLNAERADVEAALAQSGLDAQGFAEQGRRLAHIQADVARLEARWLELHGELDALEAAAPP
jgi:ATP-binding cassette subfamily F protein 3